MSGMDRFLKCTDVIDYESESVKVKARALTEGLKADRDKAVALFYFVRDEIRHNPYAPGFVRKNYRASATLERGHGHCHHKAVVLVALSRAAGIPARLGYIDILDHLISDKFRKMIGGGNLLILHGYAELYIYGKWIHLSPAYDLETCTQSGFVPVEFDGVNDAKDSQFNKDGKPHTEHRKDHGWFDDFPLDYLIEYTNQWVTEQGWDWNQFTDKVITHTTD
jgi:transglutaminase-like putative cysteine protease